MPNQTTPTGNSVDAVLELAGLLRPDWDARLADIPAWHPRNEVDPNAPPPEPPSVDWESDENPYLKRAHDHQAGYTKSQQELAAERAVWEDDQALIERIRQQRPHLLAEEDPALQQEQDPYADRWARLEAIEAKQQADEAARTKASEQEQFQQALDSINTDLDKWAKKAGVSLDDYGRAGIITKFGQDPENDEDEATLRKHFDSYVSNLGPQQRPRVPHVPSNGGTETGVVDYDNMTRAQADAAMAEQVRAANRR